MISNSEIKLITSLQQKKYRTSYGLFVAEGEKLILDLYHAGMKLHSLYTTSKFDLPIPKAVMISEKELSKMSSLKNSNGCLAVFKIPELSVLPQNESLLVLDSIRDPGNLGTIIRLCDWFGVRYIVCSEDTVDCFNPKVVQATMGSIARVSVIYTPLNEVLENTRLPIYGTLLTGANIYKSNFPEKAIIIMGSEAHGISNNVLKYISHPITIPSYGSGDTAESLNVATATAITLSEFKRSTET